MRESFSVDVVKIEAEGETALSFAYTFVFFANTCFSAECFSRTGDVPQ